MGQPVSIIREISIGEYFALVDGWKAAHADPDAPLEPPTAEEWERQQLRIMDNPHLTGVGHC